MSKENYDFPDKDGRFGDFGGKYVSETLISALDQLEETYDKIKKDKAFLKEVTSSHLFTSKTRPLPALIPVSYTHLRAHETLR